NASYDGCADMLAKEFPEAIFVQSDKNLGFSGGNNLAATHASADLLLFLNPDTEVRDGALRRLCDCMKTQPDAGAVGARLLNTDGTLQTSCIQAFPTLAGEFFDAEFLRRLSPRAGIWGIAALYESSGKPARVEGISGACLLTRRSVFDAVGGFSMDYFMYYEDMDYCLKAQRAGWKNYFVADAEVVHHGGKSSGSARSAFSNVMMAESAHRFFAKQGRLRASLYRLCIGTKALSRLALLSIAFLIAWQQASRRSVTNAFRKWASVFRWSLGAEKWASHQQFRSAS